MSKLDKSNEFNFEHQENISCEISRSIALTLDKFKKTKFEYPLNILSTIVTFVISKLDKSNELNDTQF